MTDKQKGIVKAGAAVGAGVVCAPLLTVAAGVAALKYKAAKGDKTAEAVLSEGMKYAKKGAAYAGSRGGKQAINSAIGFAMWTILGAITGDMGAVHKHGVGGDSQS